MVKRKSASQINKLENTFEKMIKKGISNDQLQKMNLREFNKALGTHKTNNKSLEGEKRVLKQIFQNREQVLKLNFQKRGIENPRMQAFRRKEFKILFSVPQKHHVKPPRKPPKWTDIKVNAYVHKKDRSFTIKTFEQLKELKDELEGSGHNYSKTRNLVVSEDSKKIIFNTYNAYQQFDYGSDIHF